jgi:hypothetical protein
MSALSTSLTTTFLALASLAAASASAETVVIRDSRCVRASAEAVHASITNYPAYASLPGAKYAIKLGAASIPLLRMTKAQAAYSLREAAATKALVYVELQPTNLQDTGYYPRFFLDCSSDGKGSRFQHRCRLLPREEYAAFRLKDAAPSAYGLSDFRSTLSIEGSSPACAEGRTRLEYELRLVGDSRQVEQIKQKVLEPAGALAGTLGRIFHEETFFRAYYENFYQGWASALE